MRRAQAAALVNVYSVALREVAALSSSPGPSAAGVGQAGAASGGSGAGLRQLRSWQALARAGPHPLTSTGL